MCNLSPALSTGRLKKSIFIGTDFQEVQKEFEKILNAFRDWDAFSQSDMDYLGIYVY